MRMPRGCTFIENTSWSNSMTKLEEFKRVRISFCPETEEENDFLKKLQRRKSKGANLNIGNLLLTQALLNHNNNRLMHEQEDFIKSLKKVLTEFGIQEMIGRQSTEISQIATNQIERKDIPAPVQVSAMNSVPVQKEPPAISSDALRNDLKNTEKEVNENNENHQEPEIMIDESVNILKGKSFF